jgi:hypothetical protein
MTHWLFLLLRFFVIPGRAKREPGIQRLLREIPGSMSSGRPEAGPVGIAPE